MKSHEIMRTVLKPHGYKNIASELKLSCSIVEKWARPNLDGRSAELSPLDRLVALTAITGDQRLMQWLCAQEDGVFVANPAVKPLRTMKALQQAEAVVLREEAELLSALAGLLGEPESSAAKVSRLRAMWEQCKADMERLVRALERGEFRRKLPAWLVKFYPFWDALTPGGLI